jgi:hypothetical protein
MATYFLRKCVRGLLAVTLALFALPAWPVIYSSAFDPAEFSGTALFQFNDSCLATDGFYTASMCNLQMLSAHVDITDDGTGGTGQLDFGANSADMMSLIIDGGELVGVNTGLVGFVFASPCTGTACGVPWWIQFQAQFLSAAAFEDPVFLFTGSCDGLECFPNQEPAGVAPNVTFTRLAAPEPATLALALAGLATGWLVRRRGRRAT